tara:strand:- start:48 stop:3665 length:3618 start_codon:yes stop_codon:yes gene_type:complete
MVAYNFEVLGEEEQDDVVKSVSEPAKLYNFEVLGEDEDLDKPVSEPAKLDNFETFGPDDPEIATREAVNSLPSAETINDLMTDKNFSVVGQYMEQRFGMQESRHGRQKIIDSYVNHMRKFNFGQTVTTGTELAYLNTDNETKKIAAGQAYALFDNMKGAFSEEYTFGQKADAVGDYARALIVDPINLVSLGFGKLIAGGATKVAAQIAKDTVKKLVGEYTASLGKKAVGSTLTKAMKVEATKIEQRVLGQIIRGETVEGVTKGAFAAGIKKLGRKEIIATAAFDSAAAVTVDAVYQKALRVSESGLVPDNYSVLQGALTGVTGVFGGGLAYGLTLMSKAPHSSSSLGLFMQAYDNASATEAAVLKLASKERKKSNREAIKNMDFAEFQKALTKSTTAAARWAAKVNNGDKLRRTAEEASDPRRDELLGAFFHGVADDDNSFKGLKDIFDDFGISLSNEGDNFANFTDFLTDTIKALPKEARTEVNSLYKLTMQKLPEFHKMGLVRGMDALASIASEAGRTLNTFSKLSQSLKLAKGQTAAEKYNEVVEETLDAPTKNLRDKISDGTSGLQQNMIRMLITHPGTTALNLVGWANATAMQSAGDILRGALYGGRALGEMAIGRNTKATDFATKSKLMFTLQRQKATNLVSPYATQQAAYSFLAANPKSSKELFRYMSGGIELDDVYKNIGIDMSAIEKPGGFEKLMDLAQTMYGVKAQDMYTKSQEFMYALDKQIRINYGMTYSEFLQDPNLYKLMKGDEYVAIQAAAVEDALRNVYAKSYGGDRAKGGEGLLTGAARVIEDLRKYPVVGAMVPFGQFFNNTLGHMFDHTGISLVHKYVAGTSRDPLELLTKSAVGVSLIGVTTAREYKNMEEGLSLFDERGSDGSIRDRTYDFPFSFYKAIGRMGAHVARDGKVPPEMFREVVTLFGTKNLTRQLGESGKMTFDLFADIAENKDVAVVDGLVKIVQDTGAMYLSAYTRPFDPVNQVIALSRGEDYIPIDRKQGSEWVNKSTRYVDQIFTGLSGVELAPEKYSALTRDRAMAPIGRIFGYREVPAQTSIQRMFNEVGMPQWRTDIKSFIPEIQNDINKYIVSTLEFNADRVIKSPQWKNGDTKSRTEMLRLTLTRSNKETVELFENSINPEDSRTLNLYKLSRKGSGVSKDDVEEALNKLNIDKKITDLDENQLNFLVDYLDLSDAYSSSEAKRALD